MYSKLLWYLQFHTVVHNSLQFLRILSHVNQIQTPDPQLYL